METVDEDYETIRRELSADRVASFKSDVYAAVFSRNPIEQLFQKAGAFQYIAGNVNTGYKEHGHDEYWPKDNLTTPLATTSHAMLTSGADLY